MQKENILIIDDDLSICEILTKVLKAAGYGTAYAVTGTEGLKSFQEGHFDLVLLDLSLPDTDGFEVAKQLLEENAQTPIILLSAYGTIEKAVQATKIGVYDFLEKPLDRDRLLVTVRNALAHGRLQQELAQYRKQVLEKYQMVGVSQAMKNICALIDKVAPVDTPVLITGENGVGKERVALAIHNRSQRSGKPMVPINCAAIPEGLMESELFGHTKGAFTGALYAKKGRLEIADGGTVFLDEIGDMPEFMQVKLLRFLEKQEIQKVGSNEMKQVDVRLITATNHDLQEDVKNGRFREDLFYRINVVHIHIPPLRERTEDIPPLLEYFLELFATQQGLPVPHFTPAALRYLQSHPWPGNIRQLRNFVERLLLLNYNDVLDLDHVKASLESPTAPMAAEVAKAQTLQEARRHFERQFILNALHAADGHVSRAARALGIDRANLYRKMRQLGIVPGK